MMGPTSISPYMHSPMSTYQVVGALKKALVLGSLDAYCDQIKLNKALMCETLVVPNLKIKQLNVWLIDSWSNMCVFLDHAGAQPILVTSSVIHHAAHSESISIFLPGFCWIIHILFLFIFSFLHILSNQQSFFFNAH